MRLENRRGPFRTLEVLLEDVSVSEILSLSRRYARLSVLSHAPLDLPASFRLRQKKTPNIYLDEPIEAVFSRFRDTVRNEVRRTERLEDFRISLPSSVSESDEAYAAYRAFEFSQGRAPISRAEFGDYVLASAFYKGRFVSGISFFQSGDKIRVRSIFSLRLSAKEGNDPELYKAIGFASKRLVFEICRYGKERGARLVDLASINLTDPAKESIARFKSGFGAKIEDEYQYVYVSPVFRLAERIAAFRSRLLVRLNGLRRG